MKKLLHIGCGNRRHEGFINTDKDMDITKPWPHESGSVDGIVSMQVFQQLYWRDLLLALKESYRVLRKGGVMRFGTMLVDDNPAEVALGWKNVNLFSFDLLERALKEVGYTDIKRMAYRETSLPEFKEVDNRPHKGSAFIEAKK